MRCMLLALILISLCFMMSPWQSFAGVGGSDTPKFVPSPVFVGQTGFPASFTIENTSSTPNDDNNIQVLTFFLTTACGTSATPSSPCPAGQTESGVIEINPLTATGRAGTSCAGINFTVVATGYSSQYQLIPIPPGTNVFLGPKNGSGPLPPTCTVDFKVDIKKLPVHDSGDPGIRTIQLATTTPPINPPPNGGLLDVGANLYGAAAGSSDVEIVEPGGTIKKTCGPLSKEGDPVDYTITVTHCR